MSGYICIRNWEKFQHYKKRRPLWIKMYVALLDDPDYRALTAKQRGILHGLWMLYAASGGEVPASPAYIAHKLGALTEWEERQSRHDLNTSSTPSQQGAGEWVVRGRDLKALEQRGWIAITASKPLAPAIPETETEGYSTTRTVIPLSSNPAGASASATSNDAAALASQSNGAESKAARKHSSLGQLVSRFFDEYPDKEILVCELMDRGCDRDEAEALIQAEHHRREAMVS